MPEKSFFAVQEYADFGQRAMIGIAIKAHYEKEAKERQKATRE